MNLGLATIPGKCQPKQQWHGYLYVKSYWIVVRISPGNSRKSSGNGICWSVRHPV